MYALYKCMQLRHILFTVYQLRTNTYTFKASYVQPGIYTYMPHTDLYAQSIGNGKKKINVQLQR